MAPQGANIRVELQLTRVSSNREDDYMQLRITDAESRQGVLDLHLTPEEFMDLMTGRQPGSVQGVAAWFPSQDARQRIGKHAAMAALSWSHRSPAPSEDDPLVLSWLDQVKRTIGAHTVDKPTRHNTGKTTARFRVYLDNPGQGENWRHSAQALLNNMTPPWEEK